MVLVRWVDAVEKWMSVVDRVIATHSPLEHVLRLLHYNIAVKAIQLATVEGASCRSFNRNAVLIMGLFSVLNSGVSLLQEDVHGLLHNWHMIELKVSLSSIVLLWVWRDVRLSIVLTLILLGRILEQCLNCLLINRFNLTLESHHVDSPERYVHITLLAHLCVDKLTISMEAIYLFFLSRNCLHACLRLLESRGCSS